MSTPPPPAVVVVPSSSAEAADPSELDALPLAKPFYPKALFCFFVSLLCLAWLVSLELQSARHASIVIAPENEIREVSPAQPSAASKDDEAAIPITAAAITLTDADFHLAEIEMLHTLIQNDPSLDLKKTANELRTYSFSKNEAVRAAALGEMAALQSAHDKATLKSLGDALIPVQAMADKKDFAGALALVQSTLKNLPQDASLPGDGAERKLKDLAAEYEKKRAAERAAALGTLEADLHKKNADAPARLEKALVHVDPAVREEALAIQKRNIEENDKALQEHRAVERTAREEWVRFFKRFGGTIADGDFTGASDMIEQPPFEAILKGGVSDPEKVLQHCAEDIRSIQNIYEEALKDVKGIRKSVSFHMRKGGQATGLLIGANGHMLRVMPGKGAEIGVKITDLTSEGVQAIMDSGLRNKPAIALALAALQAYETPAEAEAIMKTAYNKAREPLPLHWAERFKIEKLMHTLELAEAKLSVLKKAVNSDNGDDVKAALDETKPVIADLNQSGMLSDENRDLLERAEKMAAKKALETVVLQNGKSPDTSYRGINTDQISDYREAMRRTDIGVNNGLRLGADGGLKRILIKFAGLDIAVGTGRVRRATLQIYQIESPQFEGAIIGLFRVKRPWIPDSGTWISYDGLKDHEWTIPGAAGEADIEPREDSKVLLGTKAGQWLSFDVTKYVQDVLAGKAQNNGMLLKIVNGEPEFHVRLYPETDTDQGKDSNLRPKVILDIGRDLE